MSALQTQLATLTEQVRGHASEIAAAVEVAERRHANAMEGLRADQSARLAEAEARWQHDRDTDSREVQREQVRLRQLAIDAERRVRGVQEQEQTWLTTRAQLESHIDELQSRVEQLTSTAEECTVQLTHTRSQLDQQRAWEAELAAAKDTTRSLQLELQALRAQHTAATERLTAQQQQHSSVNSASAAELSSLTEQLAQTQQALGEAEQSEADLHARLTATVRVAQDCHSQLAALAQLVGDSLGPLLGSPLTPPPIAAPSLSATAVAASSVSGSGSRTAAATMVTPGKKVGATGAALTTSVSSAGRSTGLATDLLAAAAATFNRSPTPPGLPSSAPSSLTGDGPVPPLSLSLTATALAAVSYRLAPLIQNVKDEVVSLRRQFASLTQHHESTEAARQAEVAAHEEYRVASEQRIAGYVLYWKSFDGRSSGCASLLT